MVKSGTALEFSSQEKREIKSVQLSILDPDEIKAYSVVHVTTVGLINRETGQPLESSLSDLRMGPCLKGSRCQTCMGNVMNCPGHFGHIALERPVYHFGFVDTVKKILSCICIKCSSLKGIADEDKMRKIEQISQMKNPEKKLNMLYKMLRPTRKCEPAKVTNTNNEDAPPKEGGCGAKQPNFTIDNRETVGINYAYDEKIDGMSDTKGTLSAYEAYKILEKIPRHHVQILGFDPETNKPKNMVITVLPVAPPQVRPTVEMGGGRYSEDDLTHQYTQILKTNQGLKRCIDKGEPNHILQEWINTLQFYCTTLCKNDYARKSAHKNGRPIKSIRDRISSKEGRIRGNLMGKRVDFSARTVISPDPNLALDELGVPRSLAANLTFPEPVTQRNHEYLSNLVKKDTPWKWPGAKYVKKKTGEVFDLRIAREINLEVGDIVERHIMDGDYVLFNRQPSLHKMSMMAHRVRVLPFSSFRMNLSVTKPYNADFDGDEMNMHVPQSYESKAELKEICHIPRQIVSPKANQPVMGLEQDALTGITLMSKRSIFITLDHVMNLMMFLPPDLFEGNLPEPAILKPRRLWTGKQVLSLVFPKVNVEVIANGGPEKNDVDKTIADVEVIIQKGEILKGIVDIKTVGQSRGGLVHTIWLEYGPERTRQFLTDSQRIVNNWFASHGFTVGISDTIADEETFNNIAIEVEKSKGEVRELIAKTLRGDLEFQPGKGLLESYEQQVNAALNESRDNAGNRLLARVDKRNNILHMVNAGSKGKKENLCQILACVGQQNVEGKRIPFGFQHRSLPHFVKYDLGPRSKGFVEACYLKGLTPEEFYFHTMGGREGLIDTAVKTSETGYIQRKLVKSIEDCMVNYDSTVRDANGNIVQFLYGEDGMAGELIEACKMELAEFNDKKLEKTFEITTEEQVSQMMDEENATLQVEEVDQLKRDRDELRKIFPDFRNQFFLPVNIARLMKNAKTEFKIKTKNISDLQVKDVINSRDELIKSLSVVHGREKLSKEVNENATKLLGIYIRFSLASKKIILQERLSREAFDWLRGQIENSYQKAKAHPGESVGAVAAQSISEPTTQMTLNTFHMAGISAKNVTLGVPRIKELINNTVNIKAPSLNIYIKGEEKYDEKFYHRVSHDFSFTVLRDLVFRAQIFFDPDPLDSIIEEHESFNIHNELFYLNPVIFNKITEGQVHLSPWVLRIQLRKDINTSTADSIEQAIRNKLTQALRFSQSQNITFVVLTNTFYLALSEEQHPIIRLLMVRDSSEPMPLEVEIIKRIEREILDEIPICGLEKIKKVYSKLKKKDKVKVINEEDGSLVNDKKDSHYYETDGSNLTKAFAFDYVDHTKTVTNVVPEIERVLGIEAARKALLEQIREVISHYGIYINYRHLALLCDVMCHRGYVMPINRNGINRIESGPLRKCSFEETLDMILSAAAFGEVDRLTGVSEKIMVGQLCKIGTGCFDILMDIKKLQDPRYLPDTYIQQDDDVRMDQYADPEYPNTPINPNTPGPWIGGATPGGLTSAHRLELGAFTPQTTMHSPIYSPIRATSGVGGLGTPRSMAGMSPGYMGPGSVLYSPGSRSPLSMQQSPIYSPSSLQYRPTSPHYNVSNSPSLSSSGKDSVYSPTSPGYTRRTIRNSPSYNTSSPMYSPSASNTPSSQNPGTNYTPVSNSGDRVMGGTSPTYPSMIPEERNEEDEDDENER